jgi:hypothetical protein
MPQDADRYLFFNVGLLKDSFTLEALWQDALKYHMIDQPGQLIALRLTEYYEMKMQSTWGSTTTKTPLPPLEPEHSNEHTEIESAPSPLELPVEQLNTQIISRVPATPTKKASERRAQGNVVISSPAAAEQNADEAAEYWALL